MLAKNLNYLRRKNKLSQQALADKLEVPRSTLSGWERDSAEPNIEMLIKLAETFQVKVDDLVRKKIENEDLEILRHKDLRVLAISVDKEDRQNIELVESKAQAGYLESFHDPEFIRELPKIALPQLPTGTFRAFEIQGDSMLPLEPESIVIGEYVESLDELKNSQTYIIATKDNGLVYKRVKTDPNCNYLIAVSDNPVFPAFRVDYEQIDEIWKYHAHVSFTDAKTAYEDYRMSMLNDIQTKVSEIHEKINSGN